jgi:glycosyltransferase involved in cell wall biosynthesis
MFSFEPGMGTPRRIAAAVDRLISLPPDERRDVRETIAAFSRREWTWERTAARLLDAAGYAKS